MFRIKRRRTLIRIISYTTGAFAVAIALAVTGFWMAYGLRMNVEYSYQRALSDLNDHVNNISVSLQKAQYAGTSSQLIGIAGEIRTESMAAKTDLSQIAVTDVNFEKTLKFLSQVGDYADTLSGSLAQNQKITDADRGNIKSLSKSADKLSVELGDVVSDVQTGRLTLFKSDRAVNDLKSTKAQPVSAVQGGFQSMEDNFSGMPSLIYDGPFSDNVLKKQPELTKAKSTVSRRDAKKLAQSFLGESGTGLTDDGETGGSLPTYNFKTKTVNIYVAKQGGYIVRMLSSRAVTKSNLKNDAAVNKAENFLANRHISGMEQTYTLAGNNICLINFAYKQGDVTCYPDLIKVGVALDTGEVVSYDATGFIMNHKERRLPAVKYTKDAAQRLLSPALKVNKVSLAVIPSRGTNELLCYEFKCTGEGGKQVIDYFNVTSNIEEQLYILIKTPGGTLAM